MARVLLSQPLAPDVVVFSHDHCPPHVTARHRAEAWVARVGFSFAANHVALWDVEPTINAPRQRELNRLLDQVEIDLAACRRQWWLIHSTTCLDNRWALSALPPLTLLTKKRPGSMQIRSADYDPDTGQLFVHFQGGSTLQVIAGTGVEP